MSAKVEYALRDYLKGKLAYHRMNFDLLMDNPRPIPEHTNFMEALERFCMARVGHDRHPSFQLKTQRNPGLLR